jgi:hypothetical protein
MFRALFLAVAGESDGDFRSWGEIRRHGFFCISPRKVDSRHDPVVTDGAEGVSPRSHIVERISI